MRFDPQAQALNSTIQSASSVVYDLLSERGKAIFFPKLGILSQSAEAAGKSINATIGIALEDNATPMVLNSLASLISVPENKGFSYAPSSGCRELRTNWKGMLVRKNPGLTDKSFSLPVVTSALTHGLSMGGYLFIDDGDQIISPDRYWENYDLIFKNAYHADITTFPMFIDYERFNLPGLRAQLLDTPPGKKIVLLNFPNNPTGYTVTSSEAADLTALLVEAAEAGNSIAVFIDDAYFGLVYEEGVIRESIFSQLCNAHERILAVKFDGPTKEDYVWGFRVGFITFGIKNGTPELYDALEAKLSGAVRGNISNASNISQTLLLNAYTSSTYDDEKKNKYDTLERRYRHIHNHLAEHPEYADYFTPLPYNSGYFMCLRVLSGKAEKVRKRLLDNYNTGVIAQDDLLRIAFSSTPLPMIETLFENCYHAARECAG